MSKADVNKRTMAAAGGGRWGVRSILPRKLKTARLELEAWRKQAPAVWARLGEMKAPVVIIHGDNDDWAPLSNAEYLKDALPDSAEADLVIVENGDHFLNFEHSGEVIGAVERVIEKAEARGSCVRDAARDHPEEQAP